ncbi:MAG: exodeoxyribonuclease VII large subunit, partial [Armatimonadetes bacterium]|nr:exodeoxyribonuclease VII large subunit [Candidatus Hippobium faecium]
MEDIKIKPLTVTELNQRIKENIESDILLGDVLLAGECGTCQRSSAGHIYITLKDQTSEIRCNIWKYYAQRLTFPLKTGDKIIVRGSVEVYLKGGTYQVIAKNIIPAGAGLLAMQFEALKKKLCEEGLFDENRKIPIPLFPKKIILVTSPTGAVIEDMVRAARRRMPIVDLLLIPTKVQGDGAVASIVGALKVADSLSDGDTVILARGGGSLEDLWCFNEEAVVRQVAAMKKPIITGVGHEPDTTLVDFASDLRASTPTAAMELAVQDRDKVLESLRKSELYIYNTMLKLFENRKKVFETLSNNPYLKEPERMINDRFQTVDIISKSLVNLYSNFVKDKRHEFSALCTKLEMLSPLKILSQGYSLTEKEGSVVRSVLQIKKGDTIKTYLNDG